MKKFLLIGTVLVVLLFIAGCATDKGLFGFIATTDYVKVQLKEAKKTTEAELNATKQDLQSVKKDVAEFKGLTGDVKKLLDEVSKTKQSNEELQKLAKTVETRLNDLPRETLLQLVKVLQNYLDETKAQK